MPKPRLFTVSPSTPFLASLARNLMAGRVIDGFDASDPLVFSSALLFLPNRRSCRQMRETFLALSGKPMLLPRLVPLGDVDEEEALFSGLTLPESRIIPPFERHLTLAALIKAFGQALEGAQLNLAEGQAPLVASGDLDALSLAGPLMALMEQVETERVSWRNLDGLVEDHLDHYWRITRQFLAIASDHWPALLAEKGWTEAAADRDARLKIEAERLKGHKGPVIAAGSTGSILATRDLLKTIALLPQGAVVLPGFNPQMDEAEWRALSGRDPQLFGHPHYGLARLVRHMEADRRDIRLLGAPRRPMRDQWVRIAMRSTETTDLWHSEAPLLDAAAHDGVTLVEAATEQEEALACAIALRDIAEDTAKTAALVTPNRDLANRVMAELERWRVPFDDSGGENALATPAGLIARLCAQVAFGKAQATDILMLLSHPALSGPAGVDKEAALAALDLLALRGLRDRDDLQGLMVMLAVERRYRRHDPRRRVQAKARLGAQALLRWLAEALKPLMATGPAQARDFAKAHVQAIRALGLPPDIDGLVEIVEAMQSLAATQAQFMLQPYDYPAAFEALMGAVIARKKGAEGARIRILGLPEARLLSVDRVVLAGLVEGVWPMPAALDPWLNRAMRTAFGIDPPERRIGLAAHDFTQLMGMEEVVLTRAEKVAGVPSVPSRWLQRLSAVAGEQRWNALRARGHSILSHARALDASAKAEPVPRPEPRPALALRPAALSVTEIETLQRDPYAIYARHVLKLAPLEPYDAPIGMAERGTIIHEALHLFIRDVTANGWPADALSQLLHHGETAFRPYMHHADVRGFWWPRFMRIAAWFVGREAERRLHVKHSHTELDGKISWQTQAGRRFTLSGRADRIDELDDGTLALYDYKTGGAPSDREVRAGLAPQLPLEAAMVAKGGFKDVPPLSASLLTYIRPTGLEPAGEERNVKFPADQRLEQAVEDALDGLKSLIDDYENPSQPYLSWAMPQKRRDYGGDYDHLARLAEWANDEGDDE